MVAVPKKRKAAMPRDPCWTSFAFEELTVPPDVGTWTG